MIFVCLFPKEGENSGSREIVEIPSFVVYWSEFCEVIEVAQKAEESTTTTKGVN